MFQQNKENVLKNKNMGIDKCLSVHTIIYLIHTAVALLLSQIYSKNETTEFKAVVT